MLLSAVGMGILVGEMRKVGLEADPEGKELKTGY